jgi:hypothetical protein
MAWLWCGYKYTVSQESENLLFCPAVIPIFTALKLYGRLAHDATQRLDWKKVNGQIHILAALLPQTEPYYQHKRIAGLPSLPET